MNDVKSTPRLAPGYCNDAGLEAHHSGSDVVGIAFQPRRAASRLTGWWSSSLPRLPVPTKIQLEYALLIRSRTPALGSVSHSGMAHQFRSDIWARYAISGPWGIVLLDEGQ